MMMPQERITTGGGTQSGARRSSRSGGPAAPATVAGHASKGERARAEIIRAALDIATHVGLEGITIGGVSESSGRSKSGVFAHFGSREDLQIAVLEAYEVQFIDRVLRPALGVERGLPRLRRIIADWLALVVDEAGGGCIWMSAANEYDDRPGPVRDRFVEMARAWEGHIVTAIRAAQDAGHLSGHADPRELSTMIHGMTLVLHHEVRLLQRSDSLPRVQRIVDRMLDDVRARPAASSRVPASRRASTSSGGVASANAGSSPQVDASIGPVASLPGAASPPRAASPARAASKTSPGRSSRR